MFQSQILLSRVAEQALSSAAMQDTIAEAILRTAHQALDLDSRDRLVLLAERSRTHARTQRALADRLQGADRRDGRP